MGVASAIDPVARKPLLWDFVVGSLFIHDSQPFPELSSGKETWLTRQTSATTKAHALGALLTDIARALQTAVCAQTGCHECACSIECSRTQVKGSLSRFADMQLQLN